MSPRFLQSIGVAAVIGAVIVLLKLVSVPLAGANASAVAADVSNAGPAPVTAWGEADLQGIWRDDYQVPLQRPSRYASKEFFKREWFNYIIVRALIEKVDLVLGFIASGEYDNWCCDSFFADVFGNGGAIEPWEHKIKDNEVVLTSIQ